MVRLCRIRMVRGKSDQNKSGRTLWRTLLGICFTCLSNCPQFRHRCEFSTISYISCSCAAIITSRPAGDGQAVSGVLDLIFEKFWPWNTKGFSVAYLKLTWCDVTDVWITCEFFFASVTCFAVYSDDFSLVFPNLVPCRQLCQIQHHLFLLFHFHPHYSDRGQVKLK